MSLKNLRGRIAFVFPDDDYDVDQIVGVKNIRIQDAGELRRIVMKSIDPDFVSTVQPGDILIGGHNFGYGHPHYPPMTAMRDLGISCVIAESFSPGYWWGEMAEGFPQITCPGILEFAQRWDQLEVVWSENIVRNRTSERSLPFEPFGASELQIIGEGGLVKYLQSLSSSRP
ncbi:3-isopropylmalate dehydratase [Paraburkholderia sp. Ac-20336]|uniref:3-isopropylmalate dehydratase n=1 Tax=Burkholderiaceae TaxID=119060 RepID=UPI00141F0AD4|nr:MULTISPECIES: 3-isopropylmalate dehydratase [Burkholderiaceae]MBN3802367.1 3-isopropylmalate dehydratase [Paraburkholderia sp. Ac-20336]MBN3845919.1 3-isopropylmalate dehydratase [Paraburkholderia sp. Ac-20342]NIF55045.1 3-isopropylmalate dehydratase [Burkholderia sp. Ax-1724]NIF77306.1 3-isopropylmalate dehydratase [Paraburkholderia sp. Cy-641]